MNIYVRGTRRATYHIWGNLFHHFTGQVSDLLVHDIVDTNRIAVVLAHYEYQFWRGMVETYLILWLPTTDDSFSGVCISRVVPDSNDLAI